MSDFEEKFFDELEEEAKTQELEEIKAQQKPMSFDPSEAPRGYWDFGYNAPIGFLYDENSEL